MTRPVLAGATRGVDAAGHALADAAAARRSRGGGLPVLPAFAGACLRPVADDGRLARRCAAGTTLAWSHQPALRSITATAQQAMPSPRPSAPSPSARRPLTVTGAPGPRLRSLLHLVPPWRQLRRLAHHGAVDVADGPPGVGDDGADLGEQVDAVGAAPARVGVGEVLADVAEAGGAEQRVGDGVGHGVGVAVAGQAALAVERAARRAPAAAPGRR